MPTPVRTDVIDRIGSADMAATEAVHGAVRGALKWGAISALACAGGYFASPLFRSLTVQFRVYLWMCPTTLGSMVEADHRLRRYETFIRAQRQDAIAQAREQALVDELAEYEEIERRAAVRKTVTERK